MGNINFVNIIKYFIFIYFINIYKNSKITFFHAHQVDDNSLFSDTYTYVPAHDQHSKQYTYIYPPTFPPSFNKLYNQASNFKDFTTNTRRKLHQIPEIYLNEFKTSQFIQQTLDELNVNYTSGWGVNTIDPSVGVGGTGIVAEIGTGSPPCIAIRADFDGLPIEEMVDVPFKSTHEGMMHACGHDAHTAMLLGAAKLLKKYEKNMSGTVRLIFQPGEEGGAGGKFMVDEGCLHKHPPVQQAFGMHIATDLPTGVVTVVNGSTNAATDDFVIQITGRGGASATPHLTIDPLICATSIVRSLYDVYSREMYFQKEHAGLISVTYIHSGTGASNIIPEYSIIGGTIRAMKTETLTYLQERLREIAAYNAELYRCTATVNRTMMSAYPAVENDKNIIQFAQKIFNNTFFGGIDVRSEGIMAGEDFSFISQQVPSCFFSLGAGSGSKIENHVPTNVSPHNAMFAIDERVLTQGVAMHCHMAFQSLKKLNVITTPENKQNSYHDEL